MKKKSSIKGKKNKLRNYLVGSLIIIGLAFVLYFGVLQTQIGEFELGYHPYGESINQITGLEDFVISPWGTYNHIYRTNSTYWNYEIYCDGATTKPVLDGSDFELNLKTGGSGESHYIMTSTENFNGKEFKANFDLKYILGCGIPHPDSYLSISLFNPSETLTIFPKAKTTTNNNNRIIQISTSPITNKVFLFIDNEKIREYVLSENLKNNYKIRFDIYLQHGWTRVYGSCKSAGSPSLTITNPSYKSEFGCEKLPNEQYYVKVFNEYDVITMDDLNRFTKFCLAESPAKIYSVQGVGTDITILGGLVNKESYEVPQGQIWTIEYIGEIGFPQTACEGEEVWNFEEGECMARTIIDYSFPDETAITIEELLQLQLDEISLLELTLAEKIALVLELIGNIDAQVLYINALSDNAEEKAAIITALELNIADQSELIQQLTNKRDEQAEIISNLGLTIQEQANIISNMQATATEQAEIIANLGLNLEEQVEIISNLNLQIEGQSALINHLTTNLADKAYLVSQLHAENEEQAALIAAMELSFANQAGIISALNLEISDDAEIIANLGLSISEQINLVNMLELSNIEKQELIDRLQITIEEQALQIIAMNLNLQEQADYILSLNLNNADMAALISQLGLSIDEQATLINNLKLALADDAEIIANLNLKLDEEETITSALTAVIAEQQKLLDEIQSQKQESKKEFINYKTIIVGSSILITIGYFILRKPKISKLRKK